MFCIWHGYHSVDYLTLFCNSLDVYLYHNVHFRKFQVNEYSSIKFRVRFPCLCVPYKIMHVAGPQYILADEYNGDWFSIPKIRVQREKVRSIITLRYNSYPEYNLGWREGSVLSLSFWHGCSWNQAKLLAGVKMTNLGFEKLLENNMGNNFSYLFS